MSPNPLPDYATKRLIAYIGNKRALLPFLSSVFLEQAASAFGSASRPLSALRFLDPFCGSGAVSRLARCLGWRVMACDAEEYARIVTEAWVGVSADELPGLFDAEGGLEAVLGALNDLHPSVMRSGLGRHPLLSSFAEPEPFMARHYAPADTGSADWRTERLFYTAENAVFLDRARSAIDFLRPPHGSSPEIPVRKAHAERLLLLGALLYEAATHANTSGVFKAFHKGFGGHGRDALGRILSPMRLEAPSLWPGPTAEVARDDAASFCAARPADVCYLDPPYNQHQYGSNYHILNTLAAWDRPPVSEERGPDGRHLSIAGIPPAWIERRSPYCSKESAPAAFRALLASIDAPLIILSYNGDGIVDPGELYDALADRAEVSLRAVDYVAYRGGRQSASRRAATSEILFIARRFPAAIRSPGGARLEAREARRRELSALRAKVELDRLLAGAFDPAAFRLLAGGTVLRHRSRSGGELVLRSYLGLVLEPRSRGEAASIGPDDAADLAALLRPAALPDYEAACGAASALLESGANDRRLQELALSWLRKLAHRRYEAAFRHAAARLGAAAAAGPLDALSAGLREVEGIFDRRLEGGRPRPGSQDGSARREAERASGAASRPSQSPGRAFGPRESLTAKSSSADESSA